MAQEATKAVLYNCSVCFVSSSSNSRAMISHIERSLVSILKELSHAGIVLMGDFKTPPDYKLTNAYNLKQVVDKPTGENRILDKVLANMHSHNNIPGVFSPICSADHNVVYSPLLDTSHLSLSSRKRSHMVMGQISKFSL